MFVGIVVCLVIWYWVGVVSAIGLAYVDHCVTHGTDVPHVRTIMFNGLFGFLTLIMFIIVIIVLGYNRVF